MVIIKAKRAQVPPRITGPRPEMRGLRASGTHSESVSVTLKVGWTYVGSGTVVVAVMVAVGEESAFIWP
jgi:hypothetical protein